MRDEWDRSLVHYYPRVFRALMALSRSRHEAEDALQDAIVGALETRARGAPIRRLDAWLFVVAARKLRRRRWLARLERPLGEIREHSLEPSSSRVLVDHLLQVLSGRERELVLARYYLDLSYPQIAEHYGISVGTATSTVSRALAKLRPFLSQESR